MTVLTTSRAWARVISQAPFLAVLTLYLLATGRWGSYVGVPGAPVYIGDIGVALAGVQVLAGLATRRIPPPSLRRTPLIMLLLLTLVVYAVVRFAVDLDPSLVALRDVAPYVYAAAAVLSFLLPAGGERPWRFAIYTALVLHLGWLVGLRRLPGFPWDLPTLGTDALVFSPRPDFDAAVLGLGAAFALRDLMGGRLALGWRAGALGMFLAVSVAGMLTMETRAGLLSGLLAMATVVMARLLPYRRKRSTGAETRLATRTKSLRVATAVAVVAICSVGIAATPAGARLVQGFTGSGEAGGTASARQQVWSQVGRFVLYEPERTAVGVGFGRDFLAESGASLALEGVYQKVRSPHNYVIGTLARLGVAGALLAMVVIGLGWLLAVSALRRPGAPMTALAALVAISLPVIGLLGVVLESPFGAIPYFWALGQLAAASTGLLVERLPNTESGEAT